jgi:cell shape-determining protein MreC
LKAEIAKLDDLLFATEPLKEDNQKLREELKAYKGEKKKI